MEALFPLATLVVGVLVTWWLLRVSNMELRVLLDAADRRAAAAEERAERWEAAADGAIARAERAEEAIRPLQRQLREADQLLRELA